ncbi:MAG: type I DNA topoisomerase [Acidobacteriota bacterium]
MANTLLIVESPAKARSIQKYLGKGYVVKASMGHVRDLPPNKLAVDVEKDFRPTFVLLPKKKTVVQEIRAAAAKASSVLLAADPDREGEAICYHLQEILKDQEKKVQRILFHEITKEAVREALESPREVDPRKVNAQLARRVIDRLVGYRISPLLWDKVKKGLSAGRVQTVALRMVCEREEEIEAFRPQEYWTVTARLQGAKGSPFEAKLTQWEGKKAELQDAGQAARVLGALLGRPWKPEEGTVVLEGGSRAPAGPPWTVAAVEKKVQKRSPPPPFITSKLQQEAARLLKFPVKKTMSVAQRLYEGVDLQDGETVGLITYMRTDSTRLSPQAVEAARRYIQEAYGEGYLPPKPRLFAPAKAAQDAHEAIRPTDVTRTPEAVKAFLGRDEYALYRLIWRRFVASQMSDALFDATKVAVDCGPARFSASGAVCRFQGFLAVYELEEEEERGALPALGEGEVLTPLEIRPEQRFTEPPPRYTEASLVKALEENGIGRPSTYAAIISTIQDREYVVKEKAFLRPTDLGRLVSGILVRHFPALFDVGYTARMEEELDRVEQGKEDRLSLLRSFWKGFEKELRAAEAGMVDLRREGQPTDEVCEVCGRPMVLKMGRFGRFLACSGYPDCKSTRPLPEDREIAVPEDAKTCPACGSPMAVRTGRFGPFLACSRYPECKTTLKLRRDRSGAVVAARDEVLAEKCPQCGSPLVRKQGRYGPFVACSNYPACRFIQREGAEVPCPKCGKPLARRFGKSRKAFYGCTGYPECDFLSFDKPVAGPCPACGSKWLVERRRGGQVLKACPDKACGWTEPKA